MYLTIFSLLAVLYIALFLLAIASVPFDVTRDTFLHSKRNVKGVKREMLVSEYQLSPDLNVLLHIKSKFKCVIAYYFKPAERQ